jgi:hypothetical protein
LSRIRDEVEALKREKAELEGTVVTLCWDLEGAKAAETLVTQHALKSVETSDHLRQELEVEPKSRASL